MELNISIQFARIGMDTYAGDVLIKNRPADFKLEQIPAQQHISAPPMLVEIDMDKIFDDLGLKRPDSFKNEVSIKSREGALQYISRLSRYGDELARIDKFGPEIISKLALEQLRGNPADINVECVPRNPPEMHFKGGGVEIQTESGGVKLMTKPNFPSIHIKAADVMVYLRQNHYVKVSVIKGPSENRIDLKV
jgi:hypothetical protein